MPTLLAAIGTITCGLITTPTVSLVALKVSKMPDHANLSIFVPYIDPYQGNHGISLAQ